VVAGIVALVTHWGAVEKFLTDLPKLAGEAASALLNGLANGIMNGQALIISAVQHLGGWVIGAVKKVLGIASPSKIMFEMGGMTAAGFAGGMAANENHVEAAGASMGGAAVSGVASARGGGSGSGGTSVNMGGVVIHVGAGADMSPAGQSALKALFAEELSKLAEKIALQVGSAPLGSEAA
jgi:hypothetical protein